MSKGYDCIKFDLLFEVIKNIEDEEIRDVLFNWAILVFNMDVVVNNNKLKKTRGIAMGLSLSPLLFILYVDFTLKGVPKDKLSMYIDDLGIVLDVNRSPEENLNFVMDIIERLDKFGLIINKKKSVVLSANPDFINVFKDSFPIVNKDKYLGRTLQLNGDGSIVNDDRFYNIKGFRVNAFPYWPTFFVKRLIGVSALDAKLRFRLLMWETEDITIRTEIWRNTWFFFKKGMGKYSYMQMVFSMFNLFRYCIDVVDIVNWAEMLIANSIPKNDVFMQIKKKLVINAKDNETGLLTINDAILKI